MTGEIDWVEVAGIAAARALVDDERDRQRARWGDDHDAEHGPQALIAAAECYEAGRQMPRWPWKPRYWKPGQERRNLVKAGALFQAAADCCPRRLPLTHVIEQALAGRARCEKALAPIVVPRLSSGSSIEATDE